MHVLYNHSYNKSFFFYSYLKMSMQQYTIASYIISWKLFTPEHNIMQGD